MYVCIYVCLFACMGVCVCMYECVYAYIYIHLETHTHMIGRIQYMYVQACTRTYIYIYVYTYIFDSPNAPFVLQACRLTCDWICGLCEAGWILHRQVNFLGNLL